MAKRGRKPKDPFSEVPSEFREAMMSAKDEEINGKVAEIAKNDAALEEAKLKDEDYIAKKREASVAGAVYREGKAANKQKIKFLRAILEGRGKDAGDSGLPEPKDEPEATPA